MSIDSVVDALVALASKKRITCYKCGYSWFYTGKSRYYLTCPRCYKKLSIKKLSKLLG
jgi:tRNA(Ile2) C34 agmatinyltransferase TiaS